MPETSHHGAAAHRLTPDLFALLLWLLFGAAALLVHRDAIATLTFSDPDNAMRLAQVRDLAAGQGWFDTTQYRVNPADGGGLMHWSRFIDAQLFAVIAVLRLFAEPAAAERWAVAIYPLLLILPLLLVFSRLLRILGDRAFALAGLAIAASSLTFVHYFAPLNIDHHNWQLLLAVTLLWLALRPGDFATGIAAAFVASLYVEISLEGLPFLIFFWALFILDWLRDGGNDARLAGFSAGLVLIPALWLLLMRGGAGLRDASCDSFSLPYLAAVASAGAVLSAALATGGGFAAALPRRLLVVALAGAAGAAALVATGPDCLAGPFAALEPLVRTYWYDLIPEGRPLWEQKPAVAALYLGPTLVGAAALVWACRRARGRPEAENWMRMAFLILCSTLLALFVARTIAVAHAYMVPPFAALATALWRWSRARRTAPGRIGAALLLLPALPLVDSLLAMRLVAPGTGQATASSAAAGTTARCPTAAMLAPLAKAPPALVFAPVHIGPALLTGTPHSVVATGHHRNHAAMNRVIAAFLAPPDAARAIVRAEGADYLVLCTRQTEVANAATVSPDGLAAHLLRGARIGWLEPVAALSSGELRVYRVAD